MRCQTVDQPREVGLKVFNGESTRLLREPNSAEVTRTNYHQLSELITVGIGLLVLVDSGAKLNDAIGRSVLHRSPAGGPAGYRILLLEL